MTAIHHAVKGLPVVLKPVEDELLSSWISRHAEYYRVSPLAMLKHGISDAVSLRAADLRLNGVKTRKCSFCPGSRNLLI